MYIRYICVSLSLPLSVSISSTGERKPTADGDVGRVVNYL